MPDSNSLSPIRDVERLLRATSWRFVPDDGVAIAELDDAQRRISCAIPRALSDYYLLVGANEKLRTAFNEICKPEQLSVRNGHVVICIENQEVVVWGYAADDGTQSDPPVYQLALEGEECHLESSTLSSFLLAQVCWQCVNGALEHSGYEAIAQVDIQIISSQCEPVVGLDPNGCHGFDAFTYDGILVCIMHTQDEPMVYWGGNSADALHDFLQRFSITD